MNKMKAKLKERGGFTLVEMLIVVAIIAILIAVSIPLVSSALEKAREATDAANERSFKAELVICYLSGKISDGTTDFSPNTVYAYDANEGTISETAPDKGYGQGGGTGDNEEELKGLILFGYVDDEGKAHMLWDEEAPDAPSESNTWGDNLTITAMNNGDTETETP